MSFIFTPENVKFSQNSNLFLQITYFFTTVKTPNKHSTVISRGETSKSSHLQKTKQKQKHANVLHKWHKQLIDDEKYWISKQ